MNDTKDKLIKIFIKVFGYEPSQGYSTQRQNALKLICKNRYREEDIIHIADSSVLTNGKVGLVITIDSICVKDAKNNTSQFIIRYDEIANMKYSKERFMGLELVKLDLFKDEKTVYSISLDQIHKEKLQKYIKEAKKIVSGLDGDKSDEWGLVFSGGGAKGAYEIGVWKYINEYKNNIKITAASGASVGALNACLFACGDYQKSEAIWKSITQDKILTFPKKSLLTMPYMGAMHAPAVATAMPGFLQNYGCFSREGLKEIIDSSKVGTKVRKSNITCIADCLNVKTLQVEYFQLNKQENSEIVRNILLASSAIPYVFPPEEISREADKKELLRQASLAMLSFSGLVKQESNLYYDGGTPVLGNNTPIEPLFGIGYKNFVVVCLSQNDKVSDTIKGEKGVRVKEIRPSEDLGNVVSGTLNFNQEYICRLIELGYQDAKRQLKAWG